MYAHHDGPMRYTEEGAAFYDPIGSRDELPPPRRVLGVNRNLLTRGFAAAGTGSIVDEFIDFWSTPDAPAAPAPTVLDEVVVEGDPNSQIAPASATAPSSAGPRQTTGPRGALSPAPVHEKPSILPYVIIGGAVLAGAYVIFGRKK